MKVLIDTNIILDVLCARPQYLTDSAKVFKFCEVKQIDGYISALSIPNIIYIMRKELNKEKISEILKSLFKIFTVVDLKSDDLLKASLLDFADYEDAVQSVAATHIKANYIVTRNIKDFRNSKITAITPSELFDRI